MRHLRQLIRRVAPSQLPVMIVGSTGAGKELVANSLHVTSGRRGAMVAFNVCAVADTMFEDALFGHKRGAFIGASQDTPGYLAEADYGTLFLDEISGLGLASQAKLPRAIETQTLRAVGAGRDRKNAFRVIAASNESLERLCEEGRFRPDLYHRLAGITLGVPSLGERGEDIPLLANVFARQSSADSASIDDHALRDLAAMDWPGNVRQLKHVIELSLVLSGDGQIDRGVVEAAVSLTSAGDESELRAVRRKEDLLSVLERVRWSIPDAANSLGVHRAMVYRRLARLNNELAENSRDEGRGSGISAN